MSDEDRAKVKIQPVLLFVLCCLGAGVLEYLLPLRIVEYSLAVGAIPGVLLFTIAGYFALHAVVTLKRHGTHIDVGEPTQVVVGDGPFRRSRNPMYLSLVLMVAGIAGLLASIWFLAATPLLVLLLHLLAIRPEEVYLVAKFGEPYSDYKARVRRWI